jgi:ABC-2 type transport system permease protein
MEYRADFLLSLISGSFAVIIQCFLWTAVYGSGDASRYYGYTYGQMMTYTIMAGIVTKLVATGFEYEIADDIKNGGLNKFIVQPMNYFIYRISCFFGRKSLQLIFITALAAIVMAVFHSFFSLKSGIAELLLFIPPILAALVLNFFIFLCVSTLAFWLTEIWAAFLGLNLLINILSGGVFPLEIFGGAALKVFGLLPFKYTIYYPISILNGKIPPSEILSGLLVQIVWILLLYLFSKFLWNAGMKKYVAVGG